MLIIKDAKNPNDNKIYLIYALSFKILSLRYVRITIIIVISKRSTYNVFPNNLFLFETYYKTSNMSQAFLINNNDS